MRRSPGFAICTALGCASFSGDALAAQRDEDEETPIDRAEVEAWLDSRAMPSDLSDAESPPEAPPPPPRIRGWVAEAGLGAQAHFGPMQHVAPPGPWFHFQLGYEIFSWVQLLAETDFTFTDTRYANRPPEPRSYALVTVGGGIRFTVRPTDWLGIYAQGDIGAGWVTDDVLETYGYADADEAGAFFGGLLGFEWYQVSPRTAIAALGGVRRYPSTFDRAGGGDNPLTAIGGLSLRHAF